MAITSESQQRKLLGLTVLATVCLVACLPAVAPGQAPGLTLVQDGQAQAVLVVGQEAAGATVDRKQ